MPQLNRDLSRYHDPGNWTLCVKIVVVVLVLSLSFAPTETAAEPSVLRLGIDAADLGTGDPPRAAYATTEPSST